MREKSGARWSFIVAIMALLSLLAASPAAARSGLVFAGAKPLSLPWKEIARGRRISVCNGSGRKVRKLTAAVSDFGFRHNGHRLANSAALTFMPLSRKVPAGKCRVLVLRATKGAKIDFGTYTGAVAATGRGAGVARLAVTVTRSEAVTKSATVSGAVEEATLHLINHAPLAAAGSQQVGDLFLEPAPEGERPLPLGAGCKIPAGGEGWDEGACPLIGNLYQGENIVHVFIAGRVVEGEGVEELPVRISSSHHLVGDYEGRLDPSLSGDEEQMVKTKLTASDSFVWALAAVLLGAGIAILLQILSGRIRPEILLERRRRAIARAYKPVPNPRRGIEADFNAADDYSEGIEKAIRKYMRSMLIVDEKSEAYKQIDASIALAEEDAKMLAAGSGLTAALDPLEAELDRARRMLSEEYGIDRTPELLARASAPLAEGALKVGEATGREKVARELTPLLRDWCATAKRVLDCEVWLVALDGDARGKGWWKKKGSHRRMLIRAAISLPEVREELFQVSDRADLDRLHASNRIESVFARLSYLGQRHGVGIPEDPGPIVKAASNLHSPVEGALSDMVERQPKKADAVNWEEWAVKATSAVPPQLTEKRYWLFSIDLLVLMVGAAAAVAAPLVTFYFGGPFGGLEDYVTLIFSATIVQVLVKAVMDKFTVFMHDISAAIDTAPPKTTIAPS